jgi:SAM-dependent methyltransferase
MLQELAQTSPIWWVRLMGEHAHLGEATATRRLLTMGGVLRAEKVLDLGCYVGGTVRILAEERECRVVGIDLSHEFLRAARAMTLNPKASFAAAHVSRLPFKDGSFDAVISEDGAFQLEEVHRVLRKGGRFILQGSVPEILREAMAEYRDYGFEHWWSEDFTEEATLAFRKLRNAFVFDHDAYVAKFGEEEFQRQLKDIEDRLIRPYEKGVQHHVRGVFTKEGPIHWRKLAHPKPHAVETHRPRRGRRHVTR